MTPFDTVYSAFLSKILDDEWDNWLEEEIEDDLNKLLMDAVSRFKFPRISLEYTEEGFVETLGNEEIQILATYMKCAWLDRNILTWENVKPLYIERDFSQANLIQKFKDLLEVERKNAEKLEANYYRTSEKKQPFDYTVLAKQDF